MSLIISYYLKSKSFLRFLVICLFISTPVLAQNDFLSENFALSSTPYLLVEGSSLTDDTDILARPTIMVPIEGSFYLKRISVNPLFVNYAVQNRTFTSSRRFFFV